eukprot:scaffold13021_cov127-Isochrysis_galbana.AAC.1
MRRRTASDCKLAETRRACPACTPVALGIGRARPREPHGWMKQLVPRRHLRRWTQPQWRMPGGRW